MKRAKEPAVAVQVTNNMTTPTTHGGTRTGAGRPRSIPDNASPQHIRMTDAEYAAVVRLIAKMRKRKLAHGHRAPRILKGGAQ